MCSVFVLVLCCLKLLQLLQLWLRLRLSFEARVHLNLVSCFHFEQPLLAKFASQRQ